MPWSFLARANTTNPDIQGLAQSLIVECKSRPARELYRGSHVIFPKFLEYTRGLAFEDKPDYDFWVDEFLKVALEG
jgi:hypothetical protein